MPDYPLSWERYGRVPLIGILRNLDEQAIAQILPLYGQAGLTTLEITINTPGAEALIRSAVEQYSATLTIGAGTVCHPAELERALAAGAQFIVTPIISEPVIRACKEQNVPCFVGALTPTEIHRAWILGATMVKVYPAASLGAEYIRHLKAPFPDIRLLPTGGITLSTMNDFLAAGASGLGIGSPLFVPELIRTRDWPALLNHFQNFSSRMATQLSI